VENYDDNRMCPVLDGFGTEPYIKDQADLYKSIKEYLESKGYKEIDYSQFNEIVLNVENGFTNMIDGEKYSVEDLIFNDMLDIEDSSN
jgi:coproporphyrinogen III oxidase-like Fe-S oxidoreductase